MSLFSKILKTLKRGNALEADWAELEQALITADFGAQNSKEIIQLAKNNLKRENADPNSALLNTLRSCISTKDHSLIAKDSLRTIVIVGVNGTGKTTSVAKIAYWLKENDRKVLLAAADTFRAAAIEQLSTWANRIGVPVVAPNANQKNADPAAVAFDGATKAVAEQFNDYIVDTAGRLHTKNDLMEQLSKTIRVINKTTTVDEVLLVVDATTGQNGISQAKTFAKAGNLTGIILTKMDGSAKGGIALAIEKELDLPIKFIGTGESLENLESFDVEKFLISLID